MTILIIAITGIISFLAFNNRELMVRLQFSPYQIVHRREYYRMLSHGFVHANWWHLIVNMFVLYFFGTNVEYILADLAGRGFITFPILYFVLGYLVAIIFASTISLVRFKDDHWYHAVGASGAVSAIMFFCIFFDPWQELLLYAAIPIPGIVFAVLYIIYSQYMSRRGGDNINHDAHLLGAVFGFISPLLIDWHLIKDFVTELTSVF